MISIHNIKRIRARATESPGADSNWVELHIEGGWVASAPETAVLNLYFNSAELAQAFYEAYPDKLTNAEIALARYAGNNPTEKPRPKPQRVSPGTI